MGTKIRLLLWTLIALLVITGCNSTPVLEPHQNPAQMQQESSERAKRLLDLATQSEGHEKLALMLEAADILAQSGDTAWARSIITNLPVNANQDHPQALEFQVKKRLIESHIAAAEGYLPLAYDRLNAAFINDALTGLPNDLARSIYQLKAQLLFDMEFYSSSIEQRVKLSELLTSGSREDKENNALVWQALMEIPLRELEKNAEQSSNRELRGWFVLASLSKNTQTNLRQQIQELDSWIARWPDHPASIELPADLQLLRQLLEEQAQQIALLLPLSGKFGAAGSAIRDGFLAAYYERQITDADLPILRFYDTATTDINILYDQAILDGAELIIGPLSKDHIIELSLRPEMPVQTLALNAVDTPMAAVPNLYQFGLGVEDEARIAAHKAWRDGHRRALIIAPDNGWGDRAADTFESEWRQLGGEITNDNRFEDRNDYVKVIQKALQLDQSHHRSREIRKLVGHIEFEPRRRQDIDMIFLAAKSSQARQVKPTLAFHYAGKIPVYGTSQIYSGRPQRKLDQDMNGVKFSTLPWLFNNQLAEKQAIKNNTENSPNLQPLYALGVDCFHLYPRLQQLDQVKKASFYGQTGKLSLNEYRQFIRQQVWAEFRQGRAQLLAESR